MPILNKKPKGWRDGQTTFNFLEWLHKEQKYHNDESIRMADPFYTSDKILYNLYKEFLKESSSKEVTKDKK